MKMKITLSTLSLSLIVLIGLFLLVSLSGSTAPESIKFIVGDWHAELKSETTIQDKTSVYRIKINISFQENNLVKIEELHLDDPDKNFYRTSSYKFSEENLIEIDGFNERFVVNRKSDNEMALDLTEEDRWNVETPLISSVHFSRVNKD